MDKGLGLLIDINVVVIIIIAIVIFLFSGWNLWQLDGGQLCQEPGSLAGHNHNNDDYDDYDDDDGYDDYDDYGDYDDDVGVGEHDQPAAGQHLLLKPPHRLLSQGELAHDDDQDQGHMIMITIFGCIPYITTAMKNYPKYHKKVIPQPHNH